MLLKFMTDIYFYAFPHLPSLPQVGDLNVFVPHSSSRWQRSSPVPTHQGIVDPGRVCWDGKGPEGLTATFLLLLILRGALEQGPCRPCHASILLPALPGLAAPGLHPVLMSKAQRERKIKPLSAAKPSSP